MSPEPGLALEPPALGPEVVAARLAEVRARIERAAGGPAPVTIVAVTKGFGPEAVAAAVGAGVEDLGENYANEMLAKAPMAPRSVRWHFLGEPQRNKLARLAPHVYLWHGLESGAQAHALARRRPAAKVLVQVNLAGGARRHGAAEEDVPTLVGEASAAGLDVRGLMTVAPRSEDRDQARHCFRRVARLARDLGLAELSMGMSGDFEVAVEEGATIVRLGRALFGYRPVRGSLQMPMGGAQPG
ncbi:MAG TPA: YggS family pyridoxal phosphate-dependent enzyme [Acidimicrobiales bacterium]|nr:YggS family pyridoxal phosphate-dependent enzyme [Acidimicrobiales bacterium]